MTSAGRSIISLSEKGDAKGVMGGQAEAPELPAPKQDPAFGVPAGTVFFISFPDW